MPSNAIKYNPMQGTVHPICEGVVGRSVRVTVRDSGPRASADQMERLFRPFERLGAEETEVEGTGLGLLMARRIATLHGGQLRLDSPE
jgi:signal transduction histidine kinase